MDEHGFVLDVFLQHHRDTEAAKTFLTRLLGEYDVPEVIHTDQLRSYGAAIRELPSLINVDHQQVISTARCNNMVEQSHRPTRRQERQRASVLMGAVLLKTAAGVQTVETCSGISEPACPDRESPPSHSHQRFRHDQTTSSEASVPDVVCGRGRGGLRFRPPLLSACRDSN